MGLIKNNLLSIIEWADNTSNTIAYKHPMPKNVQIMSGSQFIVRESQVGILVSSGKLCDVFKPGRYKLDTDNMPILTKLMGWKYGFKSPFVCDVYFINTKQFINQKWGTSSPVMMRDQDFGVVQFRGFGIYSFRVAEPELFLREILGTGATYTTEAITEQLKRQIVSGVTQAVAESNVPALDLAMRYSQLSDACKAIVTPRFSQGGFDLSSLTIENLSLTEESQKALEQRSRMTILGNSAEYTAFTAADSMKAMADNAHKGQGMGNMATMGMMFGTGSAMANMYSGNIANAQAQAQQQAQQPKGVPCVKCRHLIPQGAKFCPSCGAAQSEACPKCGKPVPGGVKFCPECGQNLSAETVCAKCGHKMTPGVKFCPECGEKI